MAEACGADENTGVIEIGAGIGVLTAELAKRAKKVVSLELDTRLIPVLAGTLEDFDNVEVFNADVLKTDLHELIASRFNGMRVVVCANLPYYITSPVIMKILEERLPIKALTVMVQKEAADRICAKPATRECGAISYAVSWYSSPKILFRVNRGSFMPSPNVDSAVIRLDVKPERALPDDEEKRMFRIIKAGFSQRRKQLANPLSGAFGLDKKTLCDIFEQLKIKPTARAEELTLDDYTALAKIIK